MSHFTMTRVDGWPNSTAVTPSHIADLDRKIFQSINGDDGGAWAPTAAIVIDSGGGGALRLTGPLVIRGGYLKTNATGAVVSFDNNDFPRLDPAHKDRTRTYLTSCMTGSGYPTFGVRPHLPFSALQPVTTQFQMSDGTVLPCVSRVPLRVCNGATLASVTVTYRPLMGNPSMRIERIGADGVATPLTSSAAGGDGNGYIVAKRPSSATSDQTTGLASINTVTIPIDGGASPGNAVIDTSQYAYFLRIVEDQTLTPTFPNVCPVRAYVDFATTANLVRSGTGATIDGFTVGAGKRVLVKNQTNPTENGIFVVASGAWGYADDSDVAGDPAQGGKYPPGLIIPVRFGTVNGGTYWQLLQTTSGVLGNWANTYGTVPTNQLVEKPAFNAAGNQYFSAAAYHVGISDDRWQ